MDELGGVVTPTPISHGGLSESRVARWCMYALMAFPIVDFGLRLPGIHPLGVIWDKVVLFALVLVALRRWLSGYRPPRQPWHKFAWWFIALACAVMFAGLAQFIVSIQGFRADIYYILYAFLIPFAVAPKDVPKLLHVAAMVAILIGLHGLYQYVAKVPTPSGWTDVHETVRTRVFSVLTSPNELGSYMALIIPLLGGMALWERHRFRKLLYIAGVPICTLTLLLTFTRGALLALVLAVLLMAVLVERRLLIALLVVAVIAFFLPAIQHRIADLFSPVYWLKSSQQGGRLEKWMTAFDRMSTNPLFGVGIGHYGGQVASLYHLSTYSDNYYAKTLGETGLAGLTLFMSMHLALFRDLLTRAIRKVPRRERFALVGGVTGLLAVFIHNTIENVFEFGPMEITYFIFAALYLVWGYGLANGEGGVDREAQQ